MADWYFRNQQQNNSLATCPGCRNLVKKGEEFCPYCARRLTPEKGPRAWLRRTLKGEWIATKFLIGVIMIMFLLQLTTDLFVPAEYRSEGGGLFSLLASHPVTYLRMGSNFHAFVLAYGQVWRLLTYCFLHFGLLHILFNCWAFWDLGRLAERIWGPKQVVAVFVLSGIAGGFASMVWYALILRTPSHSAGASGAICGILGLLLGAYYKNRFNIGEMLGPQLVRWAVYILVFGLVAGADNSAHIGGMLAGGAMGYFLPPPHRNRNAARDEKIWNVFAVASVVLLVVSFAFAVVFYAQGFDNVELLLRGLSRGRS